MKGFTVLVPALLFSLSCAASEGVKETSASLGVPSKMTASPIAHRPDHHESGKPVVLAASDSLDQTVLQDVTGDVLGFLQNLGDQTKATMGKLSDGLQYAAGYASGVLDDLLHGRPSSVSNVAWVGPLSNIITAGSNLMTKALSQSNDPSALITAEQVHMLTFNLNKFQSLAASFGVNPDGLNKAIADLSDFAHNHLHRRDPLFVDIDSVVVGHSKPPNA